MVIEVGEGLPLLLMCSPCVAFSHLLHDADGVRLRLCVSERGTNIVLDCDWGDRLLFYWSLRRPLIGGRSDRPQMNAFTIVGLWRRINRMWLYLGSEKICR